MNAALEKYLSLFIAEATAHLDQLAAQVGQPYDAAGVAQTGELLRHAHSVKGMAAAMEFDELVGLAQAVEQFYAELAQRPRASTPETSRCLVEAVAQLSAMVKARAAGSAATAAPQLIADLQAAAPPEG